MWVIWMRPTRNDARYWPGRRWLAAVDAVIWPLGWIVLATTAPMRLGLIGAAVVTCALFCGVARLRTALLLNERYWFTTWKWGKVAAGLMVIALVLKITLPN